MTDTSSLPAEPGRHPRRGLHRANFPGAVHDPLPRQVFPVRRLLAGIGLVVFASSGLSAFAQLTLDVGNVSVPAEAFTTVEFKVNNTGSAVSVGVLDFYIEVPSASGPAIHSLVASTPSNPTPVDLINGTVFQNINSGQFSFQNNTDHDQFHSITITNPQVPASVPSGLSTLATVTFDTTGVAPGQYELKLFQTSFGSTAYSDAGGDPIVPAMTVNNGFITVVPEPNAVLGVGVLLAGFASFVRWKRQSISSRNDAVSVS